MFASASALDLNIQHPFLLSQKLKSDYGFVCEGGLDLSIMAQQRYYDPISKGLKVGL